MPGCVPTLTKGEKEVTGKGQGGLSGRRLVGETSKGKRCVRKAVRATHPHTPSSARMQAVLPSWHEGGTATKDVYVLLLGRWAWGWESGGWGGEGRQGFLPSQRLLSCENHLFAEVAYLQVASPGPLRPGTYR